MLDQGKIETISAGEKTNPEMVLKLEDKNIFDFPTKLEDEPIEVKCEIFIFNKFSNVDKLRIFDGQTIPKGDYNFSIFGNQNNVNYIYSMLKSLVTITCLLEVAISPLGPELISHLYITGSYPNPSLVRTQKAAPHSSTLGKSCNIRRSYYG